MLVLFIYPIHYPVYLFSTSPSRVKRLRCTRYSLRTIITENRSFRTLALESCLVCPVCLRDTWRPWSHTRCDIASTDHQQLGLSYNIFAWSTTTQALHDPVGRYLTAPTVRANLDEAWLIRPLYSLSPLLPYVRLVQIQMELQLREPRVSIS